MAMTEQLDLLLINPIAAHGIYSGHAIYGDLATELVAVEPPLWIRLIAGYVRDRKFTVKVIDAEATKQQPAEVAQIVAELKPRLTGIIVFGHQPSASTQQMHGARQVAQAIRDADPDAKTIIVGGHVAALPNQTLREEPVTYACNGEGPITILGLLNGEKDPNIPGLVWRPCENEVVANPAAPIIQDLDKDLHGDAWDLLPMDLYRSHQWQCFGDFSKRQPYASIYTSLGCPYQCTFCCINAPFGGTGYRRRSPKAVVDEIQMLHDKYGVKTFKITDEMFILKEGHYTEICGRLIDSGLGDKINIWAYARIDTVKPQTLQMLRMAGFQWLALGIESGSEHVRDGAKKKLAQRDVINTVRSIQAGGINVIANYMFGLQDDDLYTMAQTLDLAMELNTEFVNFYTTMAYPGSKLYEQAIKDGWVLPESWKGYSQHNADCRPMDTEHISAAAVLQYRDNAFTRYFTNPRYLRMVEEKFGSETLAHVKKMTEYELPRKLFGKGKVNA